MQNPTDDALARLSADWPNWQIWIVHNVVGPPTWCARRHDDHKKVLNADSAEHLAEYLEDQVSKAFPEKDRRRSISSEPLEGEADR
jgi:hypothetical protein